jgi:hypothetical protein
MGAEAATPQASLELSVAVGPSSRDAVVVLDEDSTPPPSSGGHDVMMTPVSEPTPVAVVTDPSSAIEVLEPSPAVEMSERSLAAGAARTSSAVGAVTVEEVMELATSRYIDSPGVGIIDLETPQLPEKVLDAATERMFAELPIMETIASVSKALHKYEHAGGFAPHAALKASEAVPEVLAVGMEPAADASTPPPTSESQEVSLPQPAEVAETTTTVAATDAAEVVVGEA